MYSTAYRFALYITTSCMALLLETLALLAAAAGMDCSDGKALTVKAVLLAIVWMALGLYLTLRDILHSTACHRLFHTSLHEYLAIC